MPNNPRLVLSVVSLVAAVFSTTARAQTTSYAFTRYAGVATVAGSNDGTNLAPQFNVPLGLALDSSGNLYVADTANQTVRKISAAAVTTTLAGATDSAGATDGAGTVARFNLPSGAWSDPAGNVYIADTNNHTVRKITPAGAVTTFAGSAGVGGANDGTGSAARFRAPVGVAGDTAGNIYVADTNNHTIRKISSAGVVTTLAGSGSPGAADGAGGSASFRSPNAVAVDSAGSIYVADAGNHTIRKITAAGVVSTLAGSAGVSGASDGTGSAARFKDPHGIAVDASGTVYVADTGNNLIRRITAAGATTIFAGAASNDRSVDGVGTAARFQSPNAIVIDGAGVIFVADTSDQTIRRISAAGAVTTFAGSPRSTGSSNGTGSAGRFSTPTSIAIDSGKNFYVSDTDNHTIRKITPSGVITTLAGTAGVSGAADGTGSAARFYSPSGVAVDSADNVYVADTANRRVRKITPAGVVTTLAGAGGTGTTFLNPTGIAVDDAGNVYVSDITYSVIFKVTAAGAVSIFAGSSGVIGYVDGTGTAARFQFPIGLFFDRPSGNFYVADTGNNAIRRVSLAGAVTTVANTSGNRGTADGPAATARFDRPFAVALDAGGNIFVADFGNTIIRQITPAGTVLTIGGTAGIYGKDDGVGSTAQFFEPSGIAVDNSTGSLYIVDQANHMIRIGARSGQTSIGTQPASQNVAPGQTVTFNVVAFGSGLSYQWFKNAIAIPGATGTSYTISSAQTGDVGSYMVRVTGASGTADSVPATLTVGDPGPGPGPGPGAPTARLVNLSILTTVATAGDSFTMGYVVGGAGTTGSKPILIRAAGPTLGAAPFNITGALSDPKIELFNGSTKTSENDNWGGSSALSTAFASVGAFAYVNATSLDAAALATIAAGDNNSVRVSAAGAGTATGTVIAELYDSTSFASTTATTPRLVNVSVLKHLGTGLTAGFVIDGSAAKKVLIRAVGPTIGAPPFNVGGAIADPQLSLFSGQVVIGSNDNWGGTAELTAAFSQVGAFALPAGSRDAALLATLQPGNYTVQVSGVGGTTGVAIVEVYEVP